MKTILLVVATLITSLSFGQAKLVSNEANNKAQKEIFAIEDKWVETVKSNDDKALADIIEKVTATNFTSVGTDGSIVDKATTLKNLRSRNAKKEPSETLRQEERNVEVYGDAAVYSAKVLFRTQEEAKAGKAPASRDCKLNCVR